jgi:hypothetical protein
MSAGVARLNAWTEQHAVKPERTVLDEIFTAGSTFIAMKLEIVTGMGC